MKKTLILSIATLSLVLAPASFAGEGCSSAKAEKIQTAQADGASCSASAKAATQVAMADSASCSGEKAIQVAKAEGSSCSAKAVTQVAMADGASCNTEKAIQVAKAEGSSCSTKAVTQVALADGASCSASSKAIEVAQKTDCETSCDSKAQKIVLAQADTKASSDCSGCDKAKAEPSIATAPVSSATVVASQK